MNIQAIGHGTAFPVTSGKPWGSARGAEKSERPVPTQPQEGETVVSEPAVSNEEQAKGVIRLLEAGHFNGVADVRLRINFHEELTAIESARFAQTAGEEVPELLAAVNAAFEELLASLKSPEEQSGMVIEAQGVFEITIQQAVSDFVGGAGDAASLSEGVQLALETLADSLSPLLTYLASSENGVMTNPLGATGTIGTEPAGVPQPDVTPEQGPVPVPFEPSILGAFLENLGGILNTAVAKLQAAQASSVVLPELSEPSGNGVAYEKFLAIYNELRGITDTSAPTGETAPVNTVV